MIRLSDEQWERIRNHFPEEHISDDRPGRKPIPTRVSAEILRLIRQMSIANPLWGGPRVHGELLKLGIDIGQTSVAKYMVKRRGPPSQGWKTLFAIIPTVPPRWIYLWCRRSRFVCSTVC